MGLSIAWQSKSAEYGRIIGEIDTDSNPDSPVFWNPGSKVEYDRCIILVFQEWFWTIERRGFVHMDRGRARARKSMIEHGGLHFDIPVLELDLTLSGAVIALFWRVKAILVDVHRSRLVTQS